MFVFVPPKIHFETPFSTKMVLGDGAIGIQLGHKGGGFIMGLVVCIRGGRGLVLFLSGM